MSIRIDPEDVAVLRALRRLIPGGSARDVPADAPQVPTVSPRKATLGRVVDVAWSFNVLLQEQLGDKQLGDPSLLRPQSFGRVAWNAETAPQLEEEDWCIQVQPLDVLEPDAAALPRVFVATEGVRPFIAPTVPPGAPNPAAWWPRNGLCDVAGSPWWLVVSAGPEEGATQRWPVPIVGLSVAVRGRNITASIEYDPAFAGNAIVFEAPDSAVSGRGRMLLTATKASPVPRTVVDQLTRARLRFPGGTTIDATGIVWIPKFATYLETIAVTTGTDWLDQTGSVICPVDAIVGRAIVPHEAVAVRYAAGDYQPFRRPVTFQVFA